MIRHIAFDFDGTLVRSNRIKRDGFYEVTAGIDGAAAVLDAVFENGFRGDRFALMRELARRLAEAGAEAPDAEALAADYTRLCRTRIAAAPEVPGARATLDWLAGQGAHLYLISATPQRALEEIVADRGLERLFGEVLGAPTDKATHLRRILADRGLRADEIALVGDSRDDREAALAVGCRFVAVTDQPNAPVEADLRIPALSDLPPLLGYAGASAPALSKGG